MHGCEAMRGVWPVAAAGLLAVGGCATSPSISSERNSSVPIPAGATVQFRGQTSSNGVPANQAVTDATVHRNIQQAIVAQLTSKGYTLVDTSTNATFTVRYFLAVKTTADSYGNPGRGAGAPQISGYGLGYGRTADTKLQPIAGPEPVTNASFEVDLVDERAGRTAWRGVLQTEPKSSTPSQQRINDLVGKVMQTLPQVP